jgi:hypothetical protein
MEQRMTDIPYGYLSLKHPLQSMLTPENIHGSAPQE